MIFFFFFPFCPSGDTVPPFVNPLSFMFGYRTHLFSFRVEFPPATTGEFLDCLLALFYFRRRADSHSSLHSFSLLSTFPRGRIWQPAIWALQTHDPPLFFPFLFSHIYCVGRPRQSGFLISPPSPPPVPFLEPSLMRSMVVSPPIP